MNMIEEAIKEIAKEIAEHRGVFSTEQAVRAQLIEPVLNALGWKTTKAAFVRHNAAFENGKIPDYTLLKEGKNKLIVEAKNLSVTLTDPKVIEQLAGYCYNQGVDFGILTNGARWLLFSTFQKNPQDRIVWQADVENEAAETVARRISSFSFENIDKLDILLQTSKALEENWSKLITSAESVVNIIAQKLSYNLKSSSPSLKIGTNDIHSFTREKLSELFEYSELDNEVENPHVSERESLRQETEFSATEDAVFKRKPPREKIFVTFPNGKQFNSSKVVETFVETIREIGIEKIIGSGILQEGVGGKKFPMISATRNPKETRASRKIGEYWLMVNYSTPLKYEILKRINQRLNLGLRIELL